MRYCLALVAGLAASTAAVAEGPRDCDGGAGHIDAADLRICWRPPLIDLEAHALPLREILVGLASATGLELHLDDGVDNVRGTWAIERQPLIAVLRELLGCHGWVLSGATDADSRPLPSRMNLQVVACSPPTGATAENCGTCATDSTPAAPQAMADRLVEALLADGPRAARGNIARITELPPDLAVPSLERSLALADATGRAEILDALGRIGSGPALRAIAQAALGDSDFAVRRTALGVLAANEHAQARLLLREALKSQDRLTRELAASLLGEMPPVAPPDRKRAAPK